MEDIGQQDMQAFDASLKRVPQAAQGHSFCRDCESSGDFGYTIGEHILRAALALIIVLSFLFGGGRIMAGVELILVCFAYYAIRPKCRVCHSRRIIPSRSPAAIRHYNRLNDGRRKPD